MGLADSAEAAELLKLLYVDDTQLGFELRDQPRRHARAATLAAAARGQELLTKLALMQFESRTDLTIRQLPTLPGQVKKTEDAIKNYIRTQDEWGRLSEEHAHATVAAEFFRDLVRAFESRAWTLRALRDAEDLRERRAQHTENAEADAVARRVQARLETSAPNHDPRF